MKRRKQGSRGRKRASELEIIDFIRNRSRVTRKEIIKGIGDDAMILRNGYVISSDSFFEGIHFDQSYFSMHAVGYHAMAASLSDLAAMGANPVCALIALHLTQKITLEDIKDMYDGFYKLAKRYRFDITGGDVVTSPCLGLTISVIGRVRRPMERAGAIPGHGLYVTQFLGLAEVGRHILQKKLPQQDYHTSITKHLYPDPRLREASVIKRFASSCIDTSDGLSTDAMHLAKESHVKVVIDAEHVPIHSEVGELCAKQGVDPFEFMLSAGEDFELLFTALNVPRVPGVQVFKIGCIEKGQGLYVSIKDTQRAIVPTGYEHLRKGHKQ